MSPLQMSQWQIVLSIPPLIHTSSSKKEEDHDRDHHQQHLLTHHHKSTDLDHLILRERM